nr:hypothetical protein BaRGS_017996 [Batillaria attramentaria]
MWSTESSCLAGFVRSALLVLLNTCHVEDIHNAPLSALSNLQSLNLTAIIGPYNRAVGLAAEELHVPYLSVTEVRSESRDYTFELIPDMEDVGMAAYDLANKYGWNKISVFYDDDRVPVILPPEVMLLAPPEQKLICA